MDYKELRKRGFTFDLSMVLEELVMCRNLRISIDEEIVDMLDSKDLLLMKDIVEELIERVDIDIESAINDEEKSEMRVYKSQLENLIIKIES